jgi:predicted TIM-barrel fold metal-dependent hydrolase
LIGFAVINPRCGGKIETELARAFGPLGMRGLKVLPDLHRCPADDKCYEPVWQLAIERDVPVFCHVGGGPEAEIGRFAKVMERHPKLRLALAHAGRSYQRDSMHSADEYIAVVCEHPNASLEITHSSAAHRIVEYLVDGVGADRVLYGSDMLYRDPRPQLGWVLFSRIAPEAKRKVLGLNAARLLGLRTGTTE